MKALDIEKIMRLARYGLAEASEYDSVNEPKPEEYDDLTVRGNPRISNLQVNNQGDNPMPDQSDLEEDENDPDAPYAIDDQMIKNMMGLMAPEHYDIPREAVAAGDYKVLSGGRMYIGGKIRPMYEMDQLATDVCMDDFNDGEGAEYVRQVFDRMQGELLGDKQEPVVEFRDGPLEKRFNYEVDSLGHVNVTDAKTGKSIFLQGEDALELLGQLDMYGKSDEQVQHILSQYQHVMESAPLEEAPNGDVAQAFSLVLAKISEAYSQVSDIKDRVDDSDDVYPSMILEQLLEDLEKFEERIKRSAR